MESLLFMLDALGIITLAIWGLLDERRPKGARRTSPFRLIDSVARVKRDRRPSMSARREMPR